MKIVLTTIKKATPILSMSVRKTRQVVGTIADKHGQDIYVAWADSHIGDRFISSTTRDKKEKKSC